MAAVVIVGIGLVTWLASRPDRSTDDLAAGPGVDHVHGLGLDPGSGTLYAATHNGVFRVPDNDRARQVGTGQDTMGFTVVGTGNFLGSGHPDLAGTNRGQPALLGLIESTDSARTWQSVSLSGEVDFHTLAYAHNRIYGWDATSGRFMVSMDRRDWEARSTIQLLGFAVDPGNADRILATTPAGVQVSSDGGRTWSPLEGAPAAELVAWDATSGLWAIDPEGAVHHTVQLGREWERPGALPGPAQALLASGEILYAAAEADGLTGIYQSTDRGATWQLRYDDGDRGRASFAGRLLRRT